jgi:hypothetical protein
VRTTGEARLAAVLDHRPSLMLPAVLAETAGASPQSRSPLTLAESPTGPLWHRLVHLEVLAYGESISAPAGQNRLATSSTYDLCWYASPDSLTISHWPHALLAVAVFGLLDRDLHGSILAPSCPRLQVDIEQSVRRKRVSLSDLSTSGDVGLRPTAHR